MIKLTLTAIGNSAGAVCLTPYNPAFENQMEAARKIMKKRRAVLRELAK